MSYNNWLLHDQGRMSFAVDISFVVDIAGTRWARSRSFAGYILYIAA